MIHIRKQDPLKIVDRRSTLQSSVFPLIALRPALGTITQLLLFHYSFNERLVKIEDSQERKQESTVSVISILVSNS